MFIQVKAEASTSVHLCAIPGVSLIAVYPQDMLFASIKQWIQLKLMVWYHHLALFLPKKLPNNFLANLSALPAGSTIDCTADCPSIHPSIHYSKIISFLSHEDLLDNMLVLLHSKGDSFKTPRRGELASLTLVVWSRCYQYELIQYLMMQSTLRSKCSQT